MGEATTNSGLRFTERDYSHDGMVHQLFESQVDRTPDAVAVCCGNTQLSYRELELRSNRLAHRLLRMGVGPDVLVGLCVHRSLDMVIGLQGILKAGGAYVPLDPAYPAARIEFMLKDAAAPVLLTQSDLVPRLPDHGARLLCLDSDWGDIALESGTRPHGHATSSNLAYVIYTSGSTGQPKGVEVHHQAVVNLLCSLAREPGLTADDRLLAVTTLSFDMAGVDIHLPLTVGARIINANRTVATDGSLLADAIATHGVTVLQATPATWHLLLEADWSGECNLKILCGGETLSRELAERLLLLCGELWNLYGPTEATIWSTIHKVNAGQGPVPIGHPVANTEIWILDERNQPVDAGAPGELCIGGDGLARGYRNQPALTADRFIVHPFDDAPDARLYRTGDLARVRADGELEHLGRLDSQVKIRGFRVELGEIEAVLEQQPSVRQAIVLVREYTPGDKSLVGYVIPDSVPPTSRQLRTALSEILPDYMVPGIVVVLDKIPLTPNGKVDRQALPAPDWSRLEPVLEHVAPRTPNENTLAMAWAEVLRVDQVGVHDNLLDLGGDSLKVAQIATRIRDAFQINVPLRAIFDNPTVAGMAGVIEALSGDDTRHGEMPIRRIPRGGPIPLSFAQERVWFMHQLDPQNLAYNFQSTIRFRGTLNTAALEQALNEIVRRHEIYRTTFPTVEGRPRQVVHRPERLRLPLEDLSRLSVTQQADAWAAWRQVEFQRRFDLSTLPLVRWTLFRWGETDHTLVHMEHHLVHDGWSFNVLLNELVELYSAFSQRRPSPLPELSVQFADFAAWQHAWMQGDILDTQLAYWQQRLHRVSPLLELPATGPRPTTHTFRGRAPRTEIPLALCNDLRVLSRDTSTTLFMTMLAAFIAMLHRYTGEDDLAVGTFFANRRTRDAESLIGMILNNVVIRTSLENDPTMRELMAQVKDVVLESSNHQDVPFDRVVEAVQPTRDLSLNPLFQVAFSFHDEPMPTRGFDGLDVTITPVISNGSAKFDLSVIGIPHSAQVLGLPHGSEQDGLTMIWEHSSDIFELDMIHRMTQHYRGVLASLVANPDQHVSELSLEPQAALTAQLERWNATTCDFPRVACTHTLIRAQAEARPDALAVLSGNHVLTYRELERRSNQLARYLHKQGIGATRLVGIRVNRSLDMAVGLLGIWKAGAAYVPIDPAFPPDRQVWMMQDSSLDLVVTHSSLQGVLPEGMPVVRLDTDETHIRAEDDSAYDAGEVTPEDLAYVIYTSGSTGRPKGVAVAHRSLVNLLSAMAREPGMTDQDRLLAITTLSFDMAALELFLPLIVGGSVAIASRDCAADVDQLGQLMRTGGATIMQATPTTWRSLVDAGWTGDATLTALCGGEPLSGALAQDLIARVGTLWNMYGPTETTIYATIQRVEAPDDRVPIGRPIPNTRIYVLDKYRQPVPLGVMGELWISGEGVSCGYLGRPELTAEQFVVDPFRNDGDTMYRTGDVGRRLPDGALEYLGRTDHQVKVRGFRIELGEIETTLLRQPGIKEAAVVVREDVPGDRRLVAYLVRDSASTPSAPDTAARLRHTLPHYMIPNAWVELGTLPRTANGKIDRSALPEPTRRRDASSGSFVEPRTASERTMAEIWREILQLDLVGARDDFFARGGHSLTATMLANRIRSVFGVEMSLVSIFETPTVAGLARTVDDLCDRR